jgi:hypothetical protein
VYAKAGVLSAGGLGGAAALAWTGVDVLAWVVAATTLLFAGLALLKLVPRRPRRSRG